MNRSRISFFLIKLCSYNIFLKLFTSSCVKERNLCNGISHCANKNDLKWCKNGTSWSLPNNWVLPKDIEGDEGLDYSVCSSDNKLPGQLIPKDKRGDRQYNCIDRSDEIPFKKSKGTDTFESGNTDEKKTWLQLVHEPCGTDGAGRSQRRCIGQGASQCTPISCKSNLSLMTLISKLLSIIRVYGR